MNSCTMANGNLCEITSKYKFVCNMEVLREVIRRIQNTGFTLNREKYSFCSTELYSERYKNYGRYRMTPRNVSEVRRIVGLASWDRRFVPSFSTITAPLTAILKSHVFYLSQSRRMLQTMVWALFKLNIMKKEKKMYDILVGHSVEMKENLPQRKRNAWQSSLQVKNCGLTLKERHLPWLPTISA